MSEYDYSDFQTETPPDNLMARISDAALRQKKLESQVAQLEEDLSHAKEELRQVDEVELPGLMEQAQCEEFTTRDGIRIGVKEAIRGSIPKPNQAKALKWLEDNGYESLIKREFKIQFDRDQEAWARKFEADLAKRKKPLAVKVERKVNPQTLQSFVKQLLEEGEDFPMDLFGVFRQRRAKIDVK